MSDIFHQAMFTSEAFYEYERPLLASRMIYFGILLAISIYHILIFIYQRKKVYLYFSLFLLTIAVMEGMFSVNFS
ncbi:MAG: hypothetical protein HKN67_12205 [Saprospiraceae bacterium]|nr:hypothetical protein [Saprospiraceae bacterium]